jgi:hypothetical protein
MIPMVAFGQPDPGQIFITFILGNIDWRDVAVIIKNGEMLGKLEIQFLTRGRGKQKILGEKAILHRGRLER